MRTFRAIPALIVVGLAAAGCTGAHTPGPSQTTAAAAASANAASGGGFPAPQPLSRGASGRPAGALPDPAAVDGSDPQAVAVAAVTTMWTMDAAIDTSQYGAELRAAPYLSPDYLAGMQAHPPVGAPGTAWNTWTSHRAYTTVAVRQDLDDPPPDTATTARRQEGITVSVHGRDGYSGTFTNTVFVTLTRTTTASPWRVSAVTVAT